MKAENGRFVDGCWRGKTRMKEGTRCSSMTMEKAWKCYLAYKQDLKILQISFLSEHRKFDYGARVKLKRRRKKKVSERKILKELHSLESSQL